MARFYVLTRKWAGIGLTPPASNLMPLSARRLSKLMTDVGQRIDGLIVVCDVFYLIVCN